MKRKYLLLFAVAILGAWLRFDGLGAKALWSDEARTWRTLQFPVIEMVARLGGMGTVHPPFYFLLLRLWTGIAGDSEFALRSLAAVGGLAAVILMYFLMTELGRISRPTADSIALGPWDGSALLAASLVAVNPFQIHMSKQARSYGLGAALVVGSSWALVRALRAEKGRWLFWALYGFLALVFCFTHHLALVSVAAQVVFALMFWSTRLGEHEARGGAGRPPIGKMTNHPLALPGALLFAFLIVLAIAYVLWFPKAIHQTGAGSRLAWRGSPRWESVPNETYIALFSTFANRLAIDRLPTHPVLAMLAAVLILAAWRCGWRGRYLAVGGGVPILLIIFYSRISKIDLYYSRYLIFVQLMWLAAIASLVFEVPWRIARLLSIALLLGGSAYCCSLSWDVIGPSAKPGMRDAMGYLLEHRAPTEAIAVRNNEGLFLEALYYARGRARPLLATPLELHADLLKSAHLKADNLTSLEALAPTAASGVWIISRVNDRLEYDLDPAQTTHWRLLDANQFEQDYRWERTVLVERYRYD